MHHLVETHLAVRHLAGALPGAPDPLGHLLRSHLLRGGLVDRPVLAAVVLLALTGALAGLVFLRGWWAPASHAGFSPVGRAAEVAPGGLPGPPVGRAGRACPAATAAGRRRRRSA